MNAGDVTADEAEARGMVHPGVHGDHHQRAAEAGEHDRDPAREVQPPGQPIPAVDVDADEDRLHEEREALDREAEPEDSAEGRGEVRPQQPHLEAEDRARDHADGEQRQHHLRPAPCERAIELIAGAPVEPLDEQDHRRERDPEADERYVDRKRQRLHLTRLEQVALVHRRERSGRGRHEARHDRRDGSSVQAEP